MAKKKKEKSQEQVIKADGKEVKFQPSKWKEKIQNEVFRARILQLMDEEVILKFDKREGDANEYYDIEG